MIRHRSTHQIGCMCNSSCNTSNCVRSWDLSFRNNIPSRRRREGPTQSISHIAIWLWQIGCKIVLVKCIGKDHDIISGRPCCIQITSKLSFPAGTVALNLFSTTLCLLHRAHMPPATTNTNYYQSMDMAYPSRTIAFQAAGMITAIVENLMAHDEVRFTPAFM